MNIKLELNEYLDPQRYRLGTRLIDVELLRRVIRHIEKQEQIILQMREATEMVLSKSCGRCSGDMIVARKLWESLGVRNVENSFDGDD
jgi:hypothetical protein